MISGTAKKVEANMRGLGSEVTYIHMGVTSETSWQNAVGLAETKYGKLDILVNHPRVTAAERQIDIPIEKWGLVVDINRRSASLGTKYSIPVMLRAGAG